MPTCETATVRIIDRNGTINRDHARVKFHFESILVKDVKLITRVELLDETPQSGAAIAAQGTSRVLGPLKVLGTCEAGGGEVTVGGQSVGERLFLIRSSEPDGANKCCSAKELVFASKYDDLTGSEKNMLLQRILKILQKIGTQTPSSELDCSAPPE